MRIVCFRQDIDDVFTSRVETYTVHESNQNDLGCQRVGLQHPDVSITSLDHLGNESASP
jgi:hypothetical protein